MTVPPLPILDPRADEAASQAAWPDAWRRRMLVVADRPAESLMIHEIYTSIQGESTFAGLPCTFVRLTGCHLRCRWCDSAHAFAGGTPMSLGDIVREVTARSPLLVEVTGGEPLAQPECRPLLTRLADAGLTVLLETSGSLPIAGLDKRVTVILDLKCPGSGEESANCWANLAALKPRDEVKFVVASQADFDWALAAADRFDLFASGRPVLVAPVAPNVADADLCRWILKSGRPFRYQPQLHKLVWGADARGV